MHSLHQVLCFYCLLFCSRIVASLFLLLFKLSFFSLFPPPPFHLIFTPAHTYMNVWVGVCMCVCVSRFYTMGVMSISLRVHRSQRFLYCVCVCMCVCQWMHLAMNNEKKTNKLHTYTYTYTHTRTSKVCLIIWAITQGWQKNEERQSPIIARQPSGFSPQRACI